MNGNELIYEYWLRSSRNFNLLMYKRLSALKFLKAIYTVFELLT